MTDWLQVGVNLVAIMLLGLLWVRIKKMNEQLARRLKKRSGSGNWSADTVDSAADADSPSNSPRSTKPPDSIAPFPLENVNVPQKKQNAARNLRSSARRMRNAARDL